MYALDLTTVVPVSADTTSAIPFPAEVWFFSGKSAPFLKAEGDIGYYDVGGGLRAALKFEAIEMCGPCNLSTWGRFVSHPVYNGDGRGYGPSVDLDHRTERALQGRALVRFSVETRTDPPYWSGAVLVQPLPRRVLTQMGGVVNELSGRSSAADGDYVVPAHLIRWDADGMGVIWDEE